jgi:hypothetical protein
VGIAVEVGLGAAGTASVAALVASASAELIAPGVSADGGEVSLPAWVNGTPTHTWSPRLGGCIWYTSIGETTAVASAVAAEYPRPLLVGLKSEVPQNGYRFDLDSWDTRNQTYSYWTDRASWENLLQVWGATGNAEFILNVPCPITLQDNPYDVDGIPQYGIGHLWQKASYYAAYVQYLIGSVTMTAEQYNALNSTYNFFIDSSCSTPSTTSETAVGGNWANLRAKRGHAAPYVIVAINIGNEPYYTDGYGTDLDTNGGGNEYGLVAKAFEQAIRARGATTSELDTIPLGLHIYDSGRPTDEGRTWFYPMMDALGADSSEFSYLDMHHYYGTGTWDSWKMGFPVGILDHGFEEYWEGAESPWAVDYSKRLWIWDSVLLALTEWGETSSRWKQGCSEHGISITSAFAYHDMLAGLGWAHWLAEMMCRDSKWDQSWVLHESGWAHSQVTYRDSHASRTPGFYVCQMAQKFYGYDYLPSSWTSAYYTEPDDTYYPFVVVRVFRNPSDGHIHLFVINNKEETDVSLTGFESATLVKWDRLSASSYSKMNPIGNHEYGGNVPSDPCHSQGTAWHSETLYTTDVTAGHTPGQPFTILKMSVNHIEVS